MSTPVLQHLDVAPVLGVLGVFVLHLSLVFKKTPPLGQVKLRHMGAWSLWIRSGFTSTYV